MKQTTVGGTKRKVTNALAMAGLIIIFIAYMFPFLMVVINSLKQKRDIIKSPFSWLFTIKGLSFDGKQPGKRALDDISLLLQRINYL